MPMIPKARRQMKALSKLSDADKKALRDADNAAALARMTSAPAPGQRVEPN